MRTIKIGKFIYIDKPAEEIYLVIDGWLVRHVWWRFWMIAGE